MPSGAAAFISLAKPSQLSKTSSERPSGCGKRKVELKVKMRYFSSSSAVAAFGTKPMSSR